MTQRFGIPRRISRALNRRFLAFVTGSGLTSLITLETRGRRTGRPHRVVLPVYVPGSHRMFVVSSYGRDSDWWRNARANPRVSFARGNETYEGSVRTVTFQAFRRATGISAEDRAQTSWFRRLVRLAFLLRARISGVIVEIEKA